jgi:hypothetical protein
MTKSLSEELKTAVLNVRIRPSAKEMIDQLVAAGRRENPDLSLAIFVERLIRDAHANRKK